VQTKYDALAAEHADSAQKEAAAAQAQEALAALEMRHSDLKAQILKSALCSAFM